MRDLVRHAFTAARWNVEDLTDDEAFWEPVTPCWSVRPAADVRRGWGTGEWRVEDTWPQPDPIPITTIAWRIVHLAAWTDVYRSWTFGDASLSLLHLDVPGTAVGMVAWLHRAQDAFQAEVDALDDDGWATIRRLHYGPSASVYDIVGKMVVENVHHSAEVSLLRDLKRGTCRIQPPPVEYGS